MNSHATIVGQREDSVLPEAASVSAVLTGAEVIRLPVQWQSSRYAADDKVNLPALAASGMLVFGLLASFAALNIVGSHKVERALTVVQLSTTPPPKAPPPPPSPKKTVTLASPVVAPIPMLTVPAKPVDIITAPVAAPVEVSIPGPPDPAPPVTAPPSIERAGDLSSTMIAATPPRYPTESRRSKEQGTVVLTVTLGVDGTVADISIARSSGFERLDRAALSAVRRWRWSPTKRNGNAVMVRGVVEIPFVLT